MSAETATVNRLVTRRRGSGEVDTKTSSDSRRDDRRLRRSRQNGETGALKARRRGSDEVDKKTTSHSRRDDSRLSRRDGLEPGSFIVLLWERVSCMFIEDAERSSPRTARLEYTSCTQVHAHTDRVLAQVEDTDR